MADGLNVLSKEFVGVPKDRLHGFVDTADIHVVNGVWDGELQKLLALQGSLSFNDILELT